MVLSASTAPRTVLPHGPWMFAEIVVSCAACQTSRSKSSTSSQRSFCTRVPRTDASDCARSSAREPERSLIRRSVIGEWRRGAVAG